MKLYELVQEMKSVEKMVDDGENEQAIKDTLEGLQLAFDDKAKNIVCLIKNIGVPLTAIKEEIDRLKSHETAIKNRIDSLKAYLKESMLRVGIDIVQTDLIKIRLQDSPPSVEILDQSLIPEEFIKTEIVQTVKKKDILKMTEKGIKVPGIIIKRDKHIRIY